MSSVNRILSLFTPKDVKFIPLLTEQAMVMAKAGSLLHELFITTSSESRARVARLIKAEEQKGDKLAAKMYKELNSTFITPFDREDIDALSDKMEDVIDMINRAAQKVLLYSLDKFTSSMIELTVIIEKGIVEIKAAIETFDNLAKSGDSFRKHYKEIKRLEEKADIIYEKGITELFINEREAVELIKLKEVIQELENSVNKINTTGKVLKTIFVKYT